MRFIVNLSVGVIVDKFMEMKPTSNNVPWLKEDACDILWNCTSVTGNTGANLCWKGGNIYRNLILSLSSSLIDVL